MKKFVFIFAFVLVFAALSLFAHDDAPNSKSCHMGEKGAASMEGQAFDATGKLLCKHCNLHKSDTCQKVFQPSSDESKLYDVCEKSKVDLEKVSEEGAATLHVKGKLVKCADDGKEELFIEEATKVE